jgi:hypothetical protein
MDTNKLMDRFKSRTTLFCAAFFVSGNLLHWFHRLDSIYMTFMVTLLGFVFGHSVKEDYFATKPGTQLPVPPAA